MADLYTTAQTYSNAGAAVATLGGNARKLEVGSKFGTRILQFIEVAAEHDGNPVDFTDGAVGASAPGASGTYTDANSNMSAAINALQGFGEVYIVGVPSATEFVVAIAEDTANDGAGASDYSSMEAAIKSAIKADTSVTITELTLTGDDLS